MRTYNQADVMAIAIARYLKGAVNCFHGVASTIPMVGIMLCRRLYDPEVTYLNITGGVNTEGVPLQISTDGPELYRESKSCFHLADIFDLSARGGLDVAFLSGGQVDGRGRVNNSAIGEFRKPKVKLPGGAGSAVLIPNCRRAFVWKSKHEPRGFVDQVDFITSQGNVAYVFSPLCVFRNEGGKLVLDALMPGATVEQVAENTGFPVSTDQMREFAPVTEEELRILDEIDPARVRDAEL